jgi:hypothetical protein
MKLISGNGGPYHVSLDAVSEFERAIMLDDDVQAVYCDNSVAATGAFYAWQAQERFGVRYWARKRQPTWDPASAEAGFTVLMGPNYRKCFPQFTKLPHKSVYLFDAWPCHHPAIVRFAEDFGISHIFLSCRQASVALAKLLRKQQVHWVPEGIDPNEYRFKPPGDKDIDVLAIGRKFDAHHQRIVGPLAQAGHNYLYEVVKGKLVFPTRESFIDGLARTKISVCVPSSMTHPEQTAGMETMTLRYLQSMVSKCLLLGRAPQEMVDLFGYNPVVDIDDSNPAGQIQTLLRHYDNYQGLIDKNHAAVLGAHHWPARWCQIRNLLCLQPATSAA